MDREPVALQPVSLQGNAGQTFELYALRFRPAEAGGRIWTANSLRGAFGAGLKRLHPERYGEYFAPATKPGEGPSGFANPPRPFVFRIHAEEIGLNLFVVDQAVVELFGEVMRELGLADKAAPSLVTLPLAPSGKPVSKIRVHFLSPTELARTRGDSQHAAFGALARRVRDRISTLRALYGRGPLEIDFQAFGTAADAVRLTRCELTDVKDHRVSKATGQRHPLGGFTGFAEYQGDLAPFLPYLEAARYTGVGRQTVWGKGEISIEEI
jgi:hypothetical protein